MDSQGAEICDVLVIGGGPAGATAANLLARRGRSVVVCEKTSFPRFHIGESLLPVNNPLFEELGIDDQLDAEGKIVKHGAEILTADGKAGTTVYFREAMTPLAPTTFQVERARFDDLLLRAAGRAGARVQESCEVVSAERLGDRWKVHTRTSEGERTIESRWLIDASGRDTFLARQRSEKEILPDHRRVSVFAHFENVWRPPGDDSGNTIIVRTGDGWFWLIPISPEKTSVGVVLPATAWREAQLKPAEILDEAIERAPEMKRRMEAARLASEVMATSDFSYRTGKMAGDGYLVVGDAHAFLDPVFSTGVWLAMQGAAQAAETVVGCLQKPRRRERLLRRFSKRQERLHRHFWRLINYFYHPGFVEIFLQPVRHFGLKRAVGTFLSGGLPKHPGPWLRLEVVLAIARLQPRLGLRPPLELPPTLAPRPAR